MDFQPKFLKFYMVWDSINVYQCHSPQKNSIENFHPQP